MLEASKQQFLLAVIAEISSAFADVSLGDGATLHQARAIDDSESQEHRRAVRVNDSERHWRELSDDKLCHFDDVFNFLDPKGWVFYIPAYMIWVLRHLDDKTGPHRGLESMAIYSITCRNERSKLLSNEQGRAVCRFLLFLACHDPSWREEAEDALNRCWGRFCLEGGKHSRDNEPRIT